MLASPMPFSGAFDDDGECAPRKFGDDDFVKLQRRLSRSNTSDAYAKSALYYALTGRGNVWAIEHGEASSIICTPHPNNEGDLLVFFPFASNADELRAQIQALPRYSRFLRGFQRVLLVRVSKDICDRLFRGSVGARTEMYLPGLKLLRVPEESLDWIYPSYDIDIEKLAMRRGPQLECFRNKINKFDGTDVKIISLKKLTAEEIATAIPCIAESWAVAKLAREGRSQPTCHELHELVSPYIQLANLSFKICGSLDGLFLQRGREYIGFGLWERPARPDDTVAAIAALHRSYEKGLSEYLHFQVAQKLLCRGHKRMCIGGSETAGLDRFKRKLAPAQAHHLCTVQLFPL